MTTDNNDLPFSKRYGFEPVEIPFQLDYIDPVLRIELWNAVYIFLISKIEEGDYSQKNTYRVLHKTIWVHFFRKPLDDFPEYDFTYTTIIKNYILNDLWYKVYELIEFICRNICDSYLYQYNEFENYVNIKLRNNNSAYTLSNTKLIPITNQAEINELKQTQKSAKQKGLAGIQEHLNKAIELISKKPKPDVQNSIKESISMVEVISRIIEPTENTLGKALNKLDHTQKISSTLKAGFEKLYAYTNGKNGIRHALMDEDTFVDFEDAKFFLIACSAFTNYLIEKARKDGLLNN